MDLNFICDIFSETDLSELEYSDIDVPSFNEHFANIDSDYLNTEHHFQNEYDQMSIGTDSITFEDWYSDIHGTPFEDALTWHEQTTNFTCGVVSAEMVLKMFGINLSEAELVFEATEAGYLTNNGISIDGIRYLIELHGVNTNLSTGTIDQLVNSLDQGHKIIVPVDSGEIWKLDSPFEDFFEERADHAVVVTGIETNGEKEYVILNDPGHINGQGLKVDMSVFENAWKDSGFYFIEADNLIA